MNTKKWLTLGLTVALAGCLGWAVAACAPTEPNPNEGDKPTTPHTHTFTGWDHSETEHWRVCPDDGEIDVSTRAPHVFVGGECECGMKEADITPDEGRDTRNFWVVGSGAGDLSKCSFTELKSDFKLTKQPKKDANGYTVYTTSVLTLYAGDTMKIVQDLDWDDGLGYFGVSNIKNNDGSLVDGGGPGNITPAKGKDGKYIFTVRTKPDIAFSQCTLEFTFVEPVEPLETAEEIYIVGSLTYCDTQWPKMVGGRMSVAGCKKLDYDEATGEWSITLRLGGKGQTMDTFKLYNAVNGKYYPDGTGNNWSVGESTTDGGNYKAPGDYKISWKSGDLDVTFTKLEHTHVFDRQTKDDTQHWNVCWLDDTPDEESRESHKYDDDDDAKCDVCGYTRHIHKYTKQNRDATQHWMECPDDGEISPEGKQNHVYDQEGDKCICGAEKGAENCKHDGKILFEYYTADSVPAGVADGGTITGKCEKCGNPVEVSYDKYVEYQSWWNAVGYDSGEGVGPIVVIENNKTYYGKRTLANKESFMFIGYEVKAAGTLTLTVDIVFNNADGDPIDFLYINALFPSKIAFDADSIQAKSERKGAVVWEGKYSTHANNTALVTKWKEQIVFDEALGTEKVPFHSMTLTFTEEDIGTYLYMDIVGSSTTPQTGAATLLHVNFSPAVTSSVAPQEVAMLPENKH